MNRPLAEAPSPTRRTIAEVCRRITTRLAWRGDVVSDGRPHLDCVPMSQVLLVLLVTGSCGLLLGAQTGLQIPVESAQVLAGVVKYPVGNPFYLYHVKTWTLLHQGCAILLACGLSERVISMMLGALLGFVSLAGLSLCTLAIGRNWLVALFVPLACLGAKVFEVIQGTYIIYLLSERPWIYYGAFGTSFVVLIWSLYGVGMRRTGLCLMGLAPALHPTMGAWCLAIGVVSLAMNWRRERTSVRPLLTWLGIGMAIAGASFLYHLYQTSDLPSISPELRTQYVAAFANGWDMHRQPYPLRDVSIYYGLCGALVGLIWLACLAREADSSVKFLIQSLAISGVFGVGLALSTHFLDHLPTALVMAMPGRYLNVAVLAFPAFAVGLTARYGRHSVLHALVACAVLYVTLREFRNLTHLYVPDVHHILFVMAIATCGCFREFAPPTAARHARLLRALPWVAMITLVVLAFWPKHHDRRVAATYLVGAGAIFLPRLFRRLIDRDYVRLFVPIVVAVATAFVASDVLDWPWTIGICVVLLAAWTSGFWPRGETAHETMRAPRLLTVGRWAIAGSLACVAGWLLGSETLSALESGYQSIHVWQSDPLLHRVHEGTGMVVIAPGVRGMQLRTGRPVLLGPLNQLPYVPESAPAMNHIVQRLFHEDLLKPRPPGHKPDPGGFDAPSCRAVFEARTPAEWKELAAEFGFTQVVVRPDWRLQLPLGDRSALWALYELPSGEAPAEHVARATRDAP